MIHIHIVHAVCLQCSGQACEKYAEDHGFESMYALFWINFEIRMNWFVPVCTSMFLINRCMYWFVLVCTGTYHFVTLTQQYVRVCTMLFWYEQVCSSMYQYVLVCTCMYLLVRKSIITFSFQYKAVPAVTLNPVYLNGTVQRLCSVWFSLVQVY